MEDDSSCQSLRESLTLATERDEGCESDEGNVDVSPSHSDITHPGSGPSFFGVWGDIFFPSLTASLIHKTRTRSMSETALWELSCEQEDTRKISQAASTGERNAPSPENRSASISYSDHNDVRHDDEGQVCPSASSWSHPTPTHAAAPRSPVVPTTCQVHFRHRLATAVHSNTLHDVDGRKVVIIQSKRSAASSRRPLQFDDDFD